MQIPRRINGVVIETGAQFKYNLVSKMTDLLFARHEFKHTLIEIIDIFQCRQDASEQEALSRRKGVNKGDNQECIHVVALTHAVGDNKFVVITIQVCLSVPYIEESGYKLSFVLVAIKLHNPMQVQDLNVLPKVGLVQAGNDIVFI